MMKKITWIFVITVAITIVSVYFSYSVDFPKWFPFNTTNALKEWEEKIFKGKVLYLVEPQQEGGYLVAKSNEAASALLYRIRFDAEEFPMISWKWKIMKFPQKSAGTEGADGWIEKDDYAARVYVIFPSWYFKHIQCLEYVWHQDLTENTIMTSPYYGNIKLIVAESGVKNLGEWIAEERNIYEDYKKAFGRPPKAAVGSIALMTDTDNTLSTAEAFYKDIKVGYANEANDQ